MTALATASSLLLGHEWVVEHVSRALHGGAAAHAYLLTGAPHVGKYTTALAIARSLLCETGTSCGSCRHCRHVARRIHPDLHTLETPPDRKNIPIKDVHEFLHGIALKPVEAERAVYVIRGADHLAEEGANAFLKTLEEPPPGVTLLLTAPDAAALLPTIVSRCQLVALHPVPVAPIAAHLVATLGIEPAPAEVIARASEGRPGWAILAAQDPELIDERQRRATDLLDLLGASRLERMQYVDRLAERWSGHADEVRGVLEVWMDVWRDTLLVGEGLADRVHNLYVAPRLERAAAAIDAEAVRSALDATFAIGDALNRNANPRLALEAYALCLPRPGAR
ncbi:MAG: polymerase subunit delta [Chloroflexota bacterium]|nr:polymerase subunit delta [Chloroflexota bacterium]